MYGAAFLLPAELLLTVYAILACFDFLLCVKQQNARHTTQRITTRNPIIRYSIGLSGLNSNKFCVDRVAAGTLPVLFVICMLVAMIDEITVVVETSFAVVEVRLSFCVCTIVVSIAAGAGVESMVDMDGAPVKSPDSVGDCVSVAVDGSFVVRTIGDSDGGRDVVGCLAVGVVGTFVGVFVGGLVVGTAK